MDVHTLNEVIAAQRAFQLPKIQYDITCMAWLLDGGLVVMEMVKY